MPQRWRSSLLGSAVHWHRRWTISISEGTLYVSNKNVDFLLVAQEVDDFQTSRGLFWGGVTITSTKFPKIVLLGFSNTILDGLTEAINASLLTGRIRYLENSLLSLKDWFLDFHQLLNKRAWISDEAIDDLIRSRPDNAELQYLKKKLRSPELKRLFTKSSKLDQSALKYYFSDIAKLVKKRNDKFLAEELLESHHFFSTIEKSPLTVEQAESTIRFHNRMQVIASAGSGKTSTMVAKAAYAVYRQIVDPSEILLLAFNRDAAEELQTRIEERFTKAGIDATEVKAQTFHAFGLRVIGQATQNKPSVASWIDQGKDIEALQEIVESIKETDLEFKSNWDLFRVVFYQDPGKFGTQPEPTDYDRATRTRGFRTLNGEVVKSREEQIIADWLFFNGVEYHYERDYEISTATADRRQYQPDFFYETIGVYHEHFALDENGHPPDAFHGYMEGVEWKRKLHKTHRTKLIETTSALIRSRDGFRLLEGELRSFGILLDPNPDRPASGRAIIPNEEILRIIRVFLTHVKNNCLTEEQLLRRVGAEKASSFAYREQLFLELFFPIWREWQRRLQKSNLIDFEDMLNLASSAVRNGQWRSPYKLILVDEFQDASWARVRLIQSLVQSRHRFLFVVGDDWQSINRFAGADPSVMSDFNRTFGAEAQLRLERTFRCSQELCDIAGGFIQKNPHQITKHVVSHKQSAAVPVHIIEVESEEEILDLVSQRISKILEKCKKSSFRGSDPKSQVSILVLGRYNYDRQFLPPRSSISDVGCKIGFSTVHSSKGLEADYIILPRVVAGSYGFPSEIEDDPLLALAMPEGDWFEHAEERRLFYVALTRAKQEVTIITLKNRHSSFVTELITDFKVKSFAGDGKKNRVLVCPACSKGVLVPRKGPYGDFFGCSRFPKCGFLSKGTDVP